MVSATNYNSNLKSSAGNKAKLTVSFDENSTDITGNYSTISCSASIIMTSGSYSQYSAPMLYLYWKDNNQNNNGYGILIASKNITALNTKTALSISGTINAVHKDDGTLTGYVYARWVYDGTGPYCPKSGECSTSETTLTTIPRATLCPNINATIGSQYAIQLNPSSNSFTHTLVWSFGSTGGTINISGNTPYYWTPSLELHKQIPNSSIGRGTLTLKTYSNGVETGITYGTLNLSANENYAKPTISGKVFDVNQKTVALTGNMNKIVSGISNAYIGIEVSTKYDATESIKKIDDVVVTNNTLTINNATKSVFTAYIVDSRGYSAETVLGDSNNLVNYIPLTINANFYRHTATDGKVVLAYSGNYYNGSFGAVNNSLTVKYRWKEKNDSSYNSWITLSPTINGNTFSQSSFVIDGDFDYQKAYTFQVAIYDEYYSDGLISSYNVTVGKPIYWWNETTFNVEGELYVDGKKLDVYYRIQDVKGLSDNPSLDDICSNMTNGSMLIARIGSTDTRIYSDCMSKLGVLTIKKPRYSSSDCSIEYVTSASGGPEYYLNFDYRGTLRGWKKVTLTNV